MWKRLDESISLSDKWARLSWVAMGVGIYILPNCDTKGRFPADSRIIKARCMAYRYDVRLEVIEDALLELDRERVLHLYDVNGKRYLAFHDHDDWNPPGALKNNAPKYPAPDPNLCECLRRESGAIAPPVCPVLSSSTSLSSEGVQGEPRPPASSPEGLLVNLALNAKVIHASERQLRTHVSGWLADKGFQFVESTLMSPSVRGKDVFWIHENYFKPLKNGKPAPGARKKVRTPGCAKCNNTGRRVNPVTKSEMDCSACVREVSV